MKAFQGRPCGNKNLASFKVLTDFLIYQGIKIKDRSLEQPFKCGKNMK